MTPKIANHEALQQVAAGQGVLVDVREPAEFAEGHLPGAINLPSTRFTPEMVQSFAPMSIYLVCNSGSRAKRIAAQLRQHEDMEIFLLAQQMDAINEARRLDQSLVGNASGWGIDRQFRLTLGLLLATFLLGYFYVSSWFILILLIVNAGLLYSAITDRCYLRIGIALLPWNRRKATGPDPETVQLPQSHPGQLAPVDLLSSIHSG